MAENSEPIETPCERDAAQPSQATAAQSLSRRSSIENAVVELHKRYAGSLLRYAFAICDNSEIAQDAVQEAFLRYYLALRRETVNADAKGWLYSTVRNYVLDRMKEYQFRNGVSLSAAAHLTESQGNPEQRVISLEIDAKARSILSSRELECLRLRNEGLRYKDIANILGIDAGTVGAFLARALKKIRTAVGR
jgi:RNA polymerase sigma-70 factor, ECF subfamily